MKENVKFDMTVPCGNGLLNIRVGAIIMKKDKILMVANSKNPEYLYSVGGRIVLPKVNLDFFVKANKVV